MNKMEDIITPPDPGVTGRYTRFYVEWNDDDERYRPDSIEIKISNDEIITLYPDWNFIYDEVNLYIKEIIKFNGGNFDKYYYDIDRSKITFTLKIRDYVPGIPILEDINIVDGQCSVSLPLPLYVDDFNIGFKTLNNDFFNDNDIDIDIVFSNKDFITINNNEDESSSNAHTLLDAINLVNNYGTISIQTPIEDENIILEKDITIKGESVLTNCQIINQGKQVLIEGLTFQQGTNSIINDGNIIISKCKFKNHTDSAIISNDEIMIDNCTFQENETSNDGACIYIKNKNSQTIINKCSFNQNYASGYGSCIYSNKGNDVEITDCEFTNNNEAKINGTCISIYGNAYISQNTFYDNIGNNQIFLINGTIEMDRNIFDGKINSSIKKHNGEVIDEGLNYWGCNDIDKIEEYNDIKLTTYLISRCKTIRKDNNNFYAIGLIDQYRNRLEKDIVTNIDPIQSSLPVRVGELFSSLNGKEITISENGIMYIGRAKVEANIDGN